MKERTWLKRMVMAALAFCALVGLARAASLEDDFLNPPSAARPMVWWHWMGHNISKDGITRDLKAMKSAGIGGATIFNLSTSSQVGPAPKNTPWPENEYRGTAWWGLVKHAAAEADRLGLNLGMHNCVGYSATGGPWITPEKSMKTVIWTVTPVTGGKAFSSILPAPMARLNFYREIAVVAISDGAVADPKNVVDLSGKMAPDGMLKWEAPAGAWLVYRFGYTTTGAGCFPAPEEVKTLECDKLRAADSKFHFEQVVQPLKDHLGRLLGRSLRHVTLDSYEAGGLNWTEGFREEFAKRRGYDPVPWLPTLDKKVIGSVDLTERFAWDFNTTISDLFVQNNFRQGRAIMNALGVQMYLEPYGGPFNTLEAAAVPDMTMAEFWNPGDGGVGVNIVGPAQAAGARVIGAEAFTARPLDANWCETPGGLKVAGDGVWSFGVNQLFLHAWVHQPLADPIKPGMSMGWWGTHFNRHQTWYEPGKAWLAYLGRSQALLQRGEVVSDILSMDTIAGAPAYRADAVAASDIAGAMIKDGRIVLPSGRSYAFLQLPATPQMLPATARKVKELVQAGAVCIIGCKPERSPSMQDFPKADEEVAAIGRELWGEGKEPERSVGKGRVFLRYEAAVAALKLAPDFAMNAPVRSMHRRDGDTDIYFVANTGTNEIVNVAFLRCVGRIPELWDAERGTHRPAETWKIQDGLTQVELVLPPFTSVFIVLRQATKETASAPRPKVGPAPAPVPVDGAWEVTFGPDRKLTLPALVSWTTLDQLAVKYFSGTAIYRKTVIVSAELLKSGRSILLDLGEVRELARVKVNGVDCGVTWHMPFRVPLGAALKSGKNKLEVEITNTWANRLIGDEFEEEDCKYSDVIRPGYWTGKDGKALAVGRMLAEFPDWLIQGKPRPSKRQTFCSWNYFSKESPLMESGLLGPVKFVVQ